jgi:hypothetical protein
MHENSKGKDNVKDSSKDNDKTDKTSNDNRSSGKMLPPIGNSPRYNPFKRSLVLSGSERPSRLSQSNDSTPIPPIGYEKHHTKKKQRVESL